MDRRLLCSLTQGTKSYIFSGFGKSFVVFLCALPWAFKVGSDFPFDFTASNFSKVVITFCQTAVSGPPRMSERRSPAWERWLKLKTERHWHGTTGRRADRRRETHRNMSRWERSNMWESSCTFCLVGDQRTEEESWRDGTTSMNSTLGNAGSLDYSKIAKQTDARMIENK